MLSEVEHQKIAPKVFISYAWEGQEHQDRVLLFGDRLCKIGIEVILDQYEPLPEKGWTQWMEDGISNADFVICICTETYHRRVQNEEVAGAGLGAQWEGKLIKNIASQRPECAKKFIIVQFEKEEKRYIPSSMLSNNRFFPTDFVLDDEQMKALYRVLTDQPAAIRPEIGNLVTLPPKNIDRIPRSGVTEPFVLSLESDISMATVEASSFGNSLSFRVKRKKGQSKDIVTRMLQHKEANLYKLFTDTDFDAAMPMAKEMLNKYPDNVVSLVIVHSILMDQGQYEDALPYIHKLLEMEPDEKYFEGCYLESLEMSKRDGLALEKLKKLASESTANIYITKSYISLLRSLEMYDDAIAYGINHPVVKDSDDFVTVLASIYWERGDLAKSLEIFESVPADKMEASEWCNLAIARAGNKQFGMAIEAINNAIKISPNYLFAQYALAEIYALMGDTEASVTKLMELKKRSSYFFDCASTSSSFDGVRDQQSFKALYT